MIGGMISSTILTLVVIPAVYALIKGFGLPHEDLFHSQPPSTEKSVKRLQRVPEPAE
jgi:Cu(I)/Ag(I) efflux system membrane protein CusA/SilA